MLKMPAVLGLEDVADAAALIGIAADRRTVARALEQARLPGIYRPQRRGDAWRVPRKHLLAALAAVAARRAMRQRAAQGLPTVGAEDFCLGIAETMLSIPALAPLVPAARTRELVERREARARATAAAQARACEARRREEARRHEAEQRKREQRLAEQRQHEEIAHRREENRLLDLCYSRAKNLAWHDRGRPSGPDWPERTLQWLDDWPRDRPPWWRPPPGMLEAMAGEPRGCVPFGHVEPDWRAFLPRYVPGTPWPWRAPS